MLLLWATLKPDGPSSNLAAVRFSSPVRIQSIRIFPPGAVPFKQQPEIIAETSPTSFYLDAYFNAQQISYDGKTKQKPTNALVQTSIAYQGGAIEFGVGQDRSEYATRLLIIRGKFEKLSLAIYGEAVIETEATNEAYQPKQFSSLSLSPIPPALDPGSSIDPTALAHSLMTLIPEDQRPSLPLIVRLMFCLKPPNEAWDEPGFPHVYADLEQDMFDLNLEKAIEMIARPVSDSVDEDVLRNFAASLSDSITDYNDEDAYFLAKVMARCAPQHTSLLQFILEHIDLARMYTESNLDRWTLIYLTDAAASVDVARQLNNDYTIEILQEIMNDPTCEERRRKAASTLLERIKAWDIFEDALINTQASFLDAATFLRDITSEENSFGIWLENMIGHKDILERLRDNDQLRPDPRPLTLWRSNTMAESNISHDDFIRFVRMCIGAACVVAVYAWADSTSIEQCKERTLAVIKFWQNVEGYRQVVNHFMVMRQMIYRLDSMLPMDDDDLPSQAGVDAEYILQTISRDPEAMLRPDLVEVVRKLPIPLNYISDSDLSDLKDVASLAKGGWNEALRLLMTHENLDSRSLMKLRVAIAIIIDALKNNGGKEIPEEMWAEGLGSLPSHLIQNLTRLDDSLQCMFGLLPPLAQKQSDSLDTFKACDELLSLMQRLQVSRAEPTRDIIALTKTLTDIVVCSDIAPDLFRHNGEASAVLLSTRRRCVSILREVIQPASIDAQSVASARAGLRALFTRVKDDIKLNIAHYGAQLFWLIDEVLPELHMDDWDETHARWVEDWLSQVIPELLSDIESFFDVQENANKLNLIKHLKRLDIGDTGVADWLVIQEQGRLERAVLSLSNVDFVQFRITHWQITNSLDFLVSLIEDSSTAQWATATLMTGSCLDAFARIFRQLCASRFCFEQSVMLAKNVNAWNVGDTQLKSLLMHSFLRAICCGSFEHFNSLANVLQDTSQSLFTATVAEEFGEALERLASAIDTMQLEENLPYLVFRVLEQVTPMDRSSGVFVFASLTKAALGKIVSWLDETLQVADQEKLQEMKLRWSVSGKPRDLPVLIPADYILDLSLSEWEYALVPPAPMPSTPKRKSPAQTAEMVGMITVSPPNALLRSPEVKGLTKIYSKNDFRQLRQTAGARQNTSRMPSRHVDDFEQGGALSSLSMPGSPTIAFAPQPQRIGPLDLSLPMKPTTFFQ